MSTGTTCTATVPAGCKPVCSYVSATLLTTGLGCAVSSTTLTATAGASQTSAVINAVCGQ